MGSMLLDWLTRKEGCGSGNVSILGVPKSKEQTTCSMNWVGPNLVSISVKLIYEWHQPLSL